MSEVGLLLEHIRACADIWNDTGVSRVRAITTATREIEAKLAAAEPEEPVDMSGEWVADDGTRVTVHPPDEGAAAIAAMDKVMGALPSAADVKGILKGHAPPPASDGYWESQQSAWRQAAAMALDEHKQAAARIAALVKENVLAWNTCGDAETARDALAARAKKSEEERRDQDRSFDALAARVATLEATNVELRSAAKAFADASFSRATEFAARVATLEAENETLREKAWRYDDLCK